MTDGDYCEDSDGDLSSPEHCPSVVSSLLDGKEVTDGEGKTD